MRLACFHSTASSKCARRAHLELVSPACVHPTASSKWARRAHLELVSLACVHPTASSKWARRAHLELVSLACVHHCHLCCPNSSSKCALQSNFTTHKCMRYQDVFLTEANLVANKYPVLEKCFKLISSSQIQSRLPLLPQMPLI